MYDFSKDNVKRKLFVGYSSYGYVNTLYNFGAVVLVYNIYEMNEPYGESLADKFVEKYGDKIIKNTLNSYKKEIKQLKQDKELLLSDYEGLLEDKRELEKTLEHRDSVLSIMWDLVRTTITADEDIIEMIKAVIDVECGAPISKKEEKLVEKFWNREF